MEMKMKKMKRKRKRLGRSQCTQHVRVLVRVHCTLVLYECAVRRGAPFELKLKATAGAILQPVDMSCTCSGCAPPARACSL